MTYGIRPPRNGASDHPTHRIRHPEPWKRYAALAVFGSVASYFLLTEHYAHTMQALLWLLVIACPVMHLFMHRGHGGHGR
jgi:hypothetical protein